MLSEKENYLMAARGEVPEWVPRNLAPSPGHAPASAWVAPGILNARRTPEGGFNEWGVELVTTRETGYMALPKPGQFMLDDITKWRDVIKAPDVSHIDWEAMAKKDLENIDRSQTAVCGVMHVGYFQQLMNFMGFTEGLCAMSEEPEEVMALFEYMSDFYCMMDEKFMEYYKPDVWCITDDTATANNPFISLEMYREMVKPFHAREAKFGTDRGLPIDMHNCGRCEDFIDDWLDFGVCVWNPAQVMNDLEGIKKKYGNHLVLEGCWDSSGAAGWPGASEDLVRAEVRRVIDTFAPGGGFIFWGSVYGAPDDEEMNNKRRWIQEEYDAYGRTFYNH
ncbi:MAG: veratrol--corrinoid protein metyltransferase [Lachnospiraceae bacterium]|nr:veratrol--corrinoid protein metyltransferase [Lachnospiraceae bacterium]